MLSHFSGMSVFTIISCVFLSASAVSVLVLDLLLGCFSNDSFPSQLVFFEELIFA